MKLLLAALLALSLGGMACKAMEVDDLPAVPRIDAPSGWVEFITPERLAELPGIITRFNAAGHGLIVLDAGLPKAELPVKPGEGVRVLDLRFNNAVHLTRGNHSRLDGIWPQYGGLATGLASNFMISDVITDATPIESWEGKPARHASTQFTDEKDYPNSHNHYQNFLSEVWNFTSNVNGISIWGDSSALVPGARVWGGFLSARSWPMHIEKYQPAGLKPFKDENFDAQLVGLEIDVLNGGLKDGTPNPLTGKFQSKIGLQVVGFGKRSTAALELRSVDTDAVKPQGDRDGVWSYGLIANNAIARDGTFIYSSQSEAGIGIDFGRTDYSAGAALFKTTRPGTGLVFNRTAQGDHGEILVDTTAPAARTVVRVAPGGLVVMSNDGKHELLTVQPDGKLISGGQLVHTERPSIGPKTTLWMFGGLAVAAVVGYLHLLGKIRAKGA